MKYYVDGSVFTSGDGSERFPFKTIQEAAEKAMAGDEVLVFPGIYRESVNPIHAGTSNQRIHYISTEPLKAVITGAEEVKSWKPYQGNVWVCRIPNGVFGEYNPYTTLVSGDWYIASFIAHTGEVVKSWKPYQGNVWVCRIPNGVFGEYNPYTTLVSGDWYIASFIAHTGEVYLNDKSLYEVPELAQVLSPKKSMASWDADFSVYTWYTEQDEKKMKRFYMQISMV